MREKKKSNEKHFQVLQQLCFFWSENTKRRSSDKAFEDTRRTIQEIGKKRQDTPNSMKEPALGRKQPFHLILLSWKMIPKPANNYISP